MGKPIHKIQADECVACGPGTLVWKSVGGGKKRKACRNSSWVSKGRYTNWAGYPSQAELRSAELGYEFEGKCESCGDEIPGSPHVDHDHKTGKARGYLCVRCNIGIGYFLDDPSRLQGAIEYLKRAYPQR